MIHALHYLLYSGSDGDGVVEKWWCGYFISVNCILWAKAHATISFDWKIIFIIYPSGRVHCCIECKKMYSNIYKIIWYDDDGPRTIHLFALRVHLSLFYFSAAAAFLSPSLVMILERHDVHSDLLIVMHSVENREMCMNMPLLS